MTSEERREVAARLRDYAGVGDFDTFSEFYTKLNEVLFESEVWFETDGEIFGCLADLVDPTCYPVIPDETEGYVFCSNCGAAIGEYGVPNYCHNCGHRVVSNHD